MNAPRLPGVLGFIVWMLLCVVASSHWQANPQYSFGWLVPPLVLYLLWRRWLSRPAPGMPSRLGKSMLWVLACLFPPLWLAVQPSPDWRLLGWALGIVVCGILLAGFARIGGRPWVRHFAFPVCFILCALPWPSLLEQPVVQGLMRGVAVITADLLNLAGVAAAPEGSLVKLAVGPIGVDEACSGVRSLQASLMAALFLGELYRFGVGKRTGLLVAAVGIAFCTNVGRTYFLASRAAAEGMDAVERYHDPAGFTVLGICFAMLWGSALLMLRNYAEPPGFTDAPAAEPARGWQWPMLLALLVVTLAGTELWFRARAMPHGADWVFVFPEKQPGFRDVKQPPATLAQLQADFVRAASWRGENTQWLAFSFRWQPGPSRSRILARMHKPENCLPSANWRFLHYREPVTIQVGALAVPFTVAMYENEEQYIHVYHTLWEDGSGPALGDARAACLQAVRRGQRNLGQQVLEVLLYGPPDGADADAAFRREIAPLLLPGGVTSGR